MDFHHSVQDAIKQTGAIIPKISKNEKQPHLNILNSMDLISVDEELMFPLPTVSKTMGQGLKTGEWTYRT